MEAENLVKKIVSLGIGVGKTVQEGTQDIMKNIETELNGLIKKGEESDDEVSHKIKSFVEDGVKNLNNVVENSTFSASEIFSQIQRTSEELIGKIKGLLDPNDSTKTKED